MCRGEVTWAQLVRTRGRILKGCEKYDSVTEKRPAEHGPLPAATQEPHSSTLLARLYADGVRAPPQPPLVIDD